MWILPSTVSDSTPTLFFIAKIWICHSMFRSKDKVFLSNNVKGGVGGGTWYTSDQTKRAARHSTLTIYPRRCFLTWFDSACLPLSLAAHPEWWGQGRCLLPSGSRLQAKDSDLQLTRQGLRWHGPISISWCSTPSKWLQWCKSCKQPSFSPTIFQAVLLLRAATIHLHPESSKHKPSKLFYCWEQPPYTCTQNHQNINLPNCSTAGSNPYKPAPRIIKI